MARSAFTLAFVMTLGTVVVARAATIAIDPTRLHLSSTAHSQSISLHNSGREKSRFQVSAFTWQQSPSGEMQLTPTDEIIFFPSLLEIAPGETRRVRVTTSVTAAVIEKSYRLFVDELPPLNANSTGAIRVLTRFGIPVFLQPSAPAATPAVSVDLRAGHLLVSLENRGNSYFLAQSVRVIGRDAAGAVKLEQDLPAWYVLARGRRQYDVALDEHVCAALSTLSVTSKTAHGQVRAEKPVPAGACAKQ